jgi:hypothetical protein
MRSAGVVGVVSAAVWFGVFVICHLLSWRSGRSGAGRLIRCYLITLLFGLMTVLVFRSTHSTAASGVLAVIIMLLTNCCLFVLYVPAVYVVLTSLSVQTIIVLRQGGGTMPTASLYDRFACRGIMEDRLATLASNGYLRADGETFRLTTRGRNIAFFFRLIKRAWKLDPGG